MTDQPDTADPSPSADAFNLGLSLGRIEGSLDAMVSRLDRRHAEITKALDARIAAEADTPKESTQ